LGRAIGFTAEDAEIAEGDAALVPWQWRLDWPLLLRIFGWRFCELLLD
jgi:hypothetical protein